MKRLDFDLPESKLFQKLLEFEKIIDLNLQKRRLEVQAALRQKNKVKRIVFQKIFFKKFFFGFKILGTLRMNIYNRYSNQEAIYQLESHPQSLLHSPSWTLRIEGKLLDNPRQPLPSSIASKKFTDFFNKVYIQLDKNLYPQDGEIEVN